MVDSMPSHGTTPVSHSFPVKGQGRESVGMETGIAFPQITVLTFFWKKVQKKPFPLTGADDMPRWNNPVFTVRNY